MSNLRLLRNCLDIHNVFCLIIQSLYVLKYILHLKKHMSSSSLSIYAQKQENICARYYCLCLAQNSRAKLHHTLQYSSDNKAAMNTGGL